MYVTSKNLKGKVGYDVNYSIDGPSDIMKHGIGFENVTNSLERPKEAKKDHDMDGFMGGAIDFGPNDDVSCISHGPKTMVGVEMPNNLYLARNTMQPIS